MGPHWQYCTALPKDIIHSGPPGRDQGSGKSAPLKGGHALYYQNSCKSILGKNECLSIQSLGGNLSLFRVWLSPFRFERPPFVPPLPLFPLSHSLLIPFHAFIFLFVQYLQYCAQLCTKWGRSRCVAWVDSPLGATGSVCEGRGTLCLGVGFVGGGICPTFRAWSIMLQKAPPLTDKHAGNTPEKSQLCTSCSRKQQKNWHSIRQKSASVEWKANGCSALISPMLTASANQISAHVSHLWNLIQIICSFNSLIICWLIHSFVRSFVHSFVHLFILFVQLFRWGFSKKMCAVCVHKSIDFSS